MFPHDMVQSQIQLVEDQHLLGFLYLIVVVSVHLLHEKQSSRCHSSKAHLKVGLKRSEHGVLEADIDVCHCIAHRVTFVRLQR